MTSGLERQGGHHGLVNVGMVTNIIQEIKLCLLAVDDGFIQTKINQNVKIDLLDKLCSGLLQVFYCKPIKCFIDV